MTDHVHIPRHNRLRRRAVTSGGASHVATLAGALYALDEVADVTAVGGTSAGALASIGLAFGVPSSTVFKVLTRLLQENRVLDKKITGPLSRGYGFCKWNVIREAVRELVGPAACMGDAVIPLFVVVTDSYTRKPVVISSWNPSTAHVKVDEAGTATAAVWPIADLQQIPSLGFGNRLYGDGGFVKNYPVGVFDGDHEGVSNDPVVGLRLEQDDVDGDGQIDLTPVRSPLAAAIAMAEATLNNAGEPDTSRGDFEDVRIRCGGSGFDFDLSDVEIKARWLRGRRAVIDRYGIHETVAGTIST